MKTQIIALTCFLTAAACGGQETMPANVPSSATTAAPADTTTTTSGMTTGGESSASIESTPAPVPTPTPAPVPQDTTTLAAPVVGNNPGAADQTPNADNTKINHRDRQSTLTPMDQGNSGSETKITAAIRKGMVADKTLSFTAKNVKVITVGNKVTLRGPVISDQEKATIEALVKQTAGVSEVDNQIEVKK